MKRSICVLVFTVAFSSVITQHANANYGNVTPDKFQQAPTFDDKKLGGAYDQYIVLKETLVGSSFEEAKIAASSLQEKLTSVASGEAAKNAANKVANASSLSDLRIAFGSLSNEMAVLVKGAKFSGGKIYVDYCPMAKGSWLSSEAVIRNPYFGDKMLSCGSVKETIE